MEQLFLDLTSMDLTWMITLWLFQVCPAALGSLGVLVLLPKKNSIWGVKRSPKAVAVHNWLPLAQQLLLLRLPWVKGSHSCPWTE